jgi:hypothetical protein
MEDANNDEAVSERLRNHGSAARQGTQGRDIGRQPSAFAELS